jgi:hypothetical protein
MSAEELAPSSLKNRRVERQNKYFNEQVLMKEEAKIIAKTHKGESILTVSNNQEEFIFNEVKDNVSEKASFDYQSDNEQRNREEGNAIGSDVIVKNSSVNVRKEMKYKNLTSTMKDFYYLLEDYSLENLRRRLNEKLKILKPATVEEIHKMSSQI